MGLSGTFHVSYPVIKTFKLAEQKGRYTPKPTREGSASTRLRSSRRMRYEISLFGFQYSKNHSNDFVPPHFSAARYPTYAIALWIQIYRKCVKTTLSLQAPPNGSNLLLLPSIYDTQAASHANTSITTFVLTQWRNTLVVPVMPRQKRS